MLALTRCANAFRGAEGFIRITPSALGNEKDPVRVMLDTNVVREGTLKAQWFAMQPR